MTDFGSIHWLDIVVFGALLAGALVGALIGLKRLVLRVIQYSIATYATVRLHNSVQQLLWAGRSGPHPILTNLITAFVVFLVVYLLVLACLLLIRKTLRKIGLWKIKIQVEQEIGSTGLKPLDRVLGGFVGMLLASVLPAILLLALYFDPRPEAAAGLQDSFVGPVALEAIDEVVASVPQHHKDRLAKSAERAKASGIRRIAHFVGQILDNLSIHIDDFADSELTNGEENATGKKLEQSLSTLLGEGKKKSPEMTEEEREIEAIRHRLFLKPVLAADNNGITHPVKWLFTDKNDNLYTIPVELDELGYPREDVHRRLRDLRRALREGKLRRITPAEQVAWKLASVESEASDWWFIEGERPRSDRSNVFHFSPEELTKDARDL